MAEIEGIKEVKIGSAQELRENLPGGELVLVKFSVVVNSVMCGYSPQSLHTVDIFVLGKVGQSHLNFTTGSEHAAVSVHGSNGGRVDVYESKMKGAQPLMKSAFIIHGSLKQTGGAYIIPKESLSDGSVSVIKVDDEDKIYLHRLISGREAQGVQLRNPAHMGVGTSDGEGLRKASKGIYIYVGEEAVLDYVRTKLVANPLELAKIYEAVELKVPESVTEQIRAKMAGEVMSLWVSTNRTAEAENAYNKKLCELEEVAKGEGVLVEDGARTVCETADDIRVIMLGPKEELKRTKEGFAREIENLYAVEPWKYVQTIVLRPGVTLDVKAFMEGLHTSVSTNAGGAPKSKAAVGT